MAKNQGQGGIGTLREKVTRSIFHGRRAMNRKGQTDWLVWALIFLVVAIVASILGFGIISGVSVTIAKWLAIIFVVLFIISVIAHTIKKA